MTTAPLSMADEKLRTRIASEAARLMFARVEPDLARAKRRAAIELRRGGLAPYDLPSDRAVRRELELLSRLEQGEREARTEQESRAEAGQMMRLFGGDRTRLLEVPERNGDAKIERYVVAFTDDSNSLVAVAQDHGYSVAVQAVERCDVFLVAPRACFLVRSAAGGAGDEAVCVAVFDEARVFSYDGAFARESEDENGVLCGEQEARWLTVGEVEALTAEVPEESEYFERTAPRSLRADRFQVYLSLLAALAHVKQDPKRHPEGDALCHSLQVFELTRAERPYDEELLTAALLHDVGKAIDRRDHVAAGLEALDGQITERTAWFIEHHVTALAIRAGTAGARTVRRLEASPDYDDLMFLAECDRRGRKRGMRVCEPEDAVDCLRELAAEDAW